MNTTIEAQTASVVSSPDAGKTGKPPELRSLTGLRAVACFMIVLHHINVELPFVGFIQKTHLENGVAFFFVLSGYILTYVYGYFNSFSEVAKFLILRIARLWPTHLAGTALAIMLIPSWTYVNVLATKAALRDNILMIHAWNPWKQIHYLYNSPSWSISCEMLFYLVFPLLLFLLRRSLFLFYSACFLPLACSLYFASFVPTSHLLGFIYTSPWARLWEFGLGILCAVYLSKGNQKRLLPPSVYEAVLITLCVACLFLTVPLEEALKQVPNTGAMLSTLLARSALCALPFAWLIVVFARGEGLFSRITAHPAMVWLGEVSFAIYLFHLSFIAASNLIVPRPAALQDIFSELALMVLFSGLFFTVVETPCRKIVAGLLKKQKLTEILRKPFFWNTRKDFLAVATMSSLLITVLYCIPESGKELPERETALLSSSPALANFQNEFIINSLTVHQAASSLKIDAVITPLSPKPCTQFINLQILTADKCFEKNVIYLLSPHQQKLPPGKPRLYHFVLSIEPGSNLKDHLLGLKILSAKGTPYTCDSPDADWWKTRLLLPLSQKL